MNSISSCVSKYTTIHGCVIRVVFLRSASDRKVSRRVSSSLLCIDLSSCVCISNVREVRAGSAGRSPQVSSRRRSRAVASRDVTRRCSDVISRQGQPARYGRLGNPCSLLPAISSHPYPTSYRSPPHTLHRVHVPLNELSPRFLPPVRIRVAPSSLLF